MLYRYIVISLFRFMLIDYHLHNHFSPDSESDTVKLLEKERELGIKDICITNHSEWFGHKEGEPGIFNYNDAVKRFKTIQEELDELRSQFTDMNISFGAELQYQESQLDDLKRFIESLPFDFIIGSVHIIDNIVVSGGVHAHELFERMDEKTAYTRYFEKILEYVEWGHFDVVGHFDVIKKYGVNYYGLFNPQKFKPTILKILQTMKEKGIGIELNTACLHQKCNELFPHPDILKWCVEVGIENYTLGSDAHELEEAGRHLNEALAIAKEAGIKTLSTYEKRKPTKHKI